MNIGVHVSDRLSHLCVSKAGRDEKLWAWEHVGSFCHHVRGAGCHPGDWAVLPLGRFYTAAWFTDAFFKIFGLCQWSGPAVKHKQRAWRCCCGSVASALVWFSGLLCSSSRSLAIRCPWAHIVVLQRCRLFRPSCPGSAQVSLPPLLEASAV